MFKYKNLVFFFCQWLSLFFGNISLNPSPFHQDMQCLNECNVSKDRGLHFIYTSVNSLLLKI